jgi:hypothetical protein
LSIVTTSSVVGLSDSFSLICLNPRTPGAVVWRQGLLVEARRRS